MELIFDSGSDWLMVEGKDCDNCKGTKYDTSESIYFNERSSTEDNRTFGTIIHLKGRTVSDWVCLQLYEMCVKPFQWFIITDQYGLPTDQVNGVLGMTQAEAFNGGYEPANAFSTGDNLMTSLFAGGDLSVVAWSTHLSQFLYDSYIDLGGPRLDGLSNEDDTVILTFPDGYFYTLEP